MAPTPTKIEARSENNGVAYLKKPLTDVYIVESYKEYNYSNTDRSMGNERDSNHSMGLTLI